jgi:Protein of unknown function (DUF2911)
MKRIEHYFIVFFLGLVLNIHAQIKTPAPSPVATINQKVGLLDVNVEYSRPSAKGRKIFGDLVPYNEIWRTGANASTKIEFTDDVTVGSIALKKGKYSFYVIPTEKEWTIIFNKNLTNWGADGYLETEDAGRTSAIASKSSTFVESFTLGVNNLAPNGCTIDIAWENTFVSVPVKFDTDSKVTESIKNVMAGPSQNDFHSAARYYYDNNKDMGQALSWINMAIEKGENFLMLRQKSLIQAKLGDTKGAIETAKKSKALAETEKNMDYVRMNEKSIEEWSKKR